MSFKFHWSLILILLQGCELGSGYHKFRSPYIGEPIITLFVRSIDFNQRADMLGNEVSGDVVYLNYFGSLPGDFKHIYASPYDGQAAIRGYAVFSSSADQCCARPISLYPKAVASEIGTIGFPTSDYLEITHSSTKNDTKRFRQIIVDSVFEFTVDDQQFHHFKTLGFDKRPSVATVDVSDPATPYVISLRLASATEIGLMGIVTK